MALSMKGFAYNITSPSHYAPHLSPPQFCLKQLRKRETMAPLISNNKKKQEW